MKNHNKKGRYCDFYEKIIIRKVAIVIFMKKS